MSRWNRRVLRRIAHAHGVRSALVRDEITGELVRVSLMRRVREAIRAAASKQPYRGKLLRNRAKR